MFSKTYSATPWGIEGKLVKIETLVVPGTPQIVLSGLPGEVVKESRERVRGSLVHLGYDVPTSRFLVHLSPAESRKQGSQFDLAIAASLLQAERHVLQRDVSRMAFLGELSLDGKIHPVAGTLPLVEKLLKISDIEQIIVPGGNHREVGVLPPERLRLASTLGEVIAFLRGQKDLPLPTKWEPPYLPLENSIRWDDIIGQQLGKRGLEIALAGHHHILLVGPPGVGKSLLAQSAASLLPPLSAREWIEVAKSHSLSGDLQILDRRRPFRSPHHSLSSAALLGGGSGTIAPGEVTLAHRGILFLDEFPEFRREAIEGLREPLESGVIHLHRVGYSLSLPAQCILIAAMNPCPCGYSLSSRRCTCSADKVRSYRRKISGPILDRMDLSVTLGTPDTRQVQSEAGLHERAQERIAQAREIQVHRYGDFCWNGTVLVDWKKPGFSLPSQSRQWMDDLVEKGFLSVRAVHKLVRVARTIADLDGRSQISSADLEEAFGLRCRSLEPTSH